MFSSMLLKGESFMESFNPKKKELERKKGESSDVFSGIYGITKPGKYYFPGKISSGCFDSNGFVVESDKTTQRKRRDNNDENDYSFESRFDPNGMYTGVPEDTMDKPVQDADDL